MDTSASCDLLMPSCPTWGEEVAEQADCPGTPRANQAERPEFP